MKQRQWLQFGIFGIVILIMGTIATTGYLANQSYRSALEIAVPSPAPSSVTQVSASPTAASLATPTPAATKQPTASVAQAKALRIEIPKIKLSTTIESVGLTPTGAMDVPKNPRNVGLYSLGAGLGQRGNVVVSGHLDWSGPAVFYNLNKLTAGDTVKATNAQGQQFTYVVHDKQNFLLQDFPMQAVFGVADKAKLQLITCSGKFDRKTRKYSHRLVVSAELISPL